MAEKQDDPKKVTTPRFRVSFPNVFKPRKKDKPEDADKWGLTMLFTKDTDLSAMKAACKAAAQEEWGDKIPKNLVMPFRDGDEKDYDGYAGMTFVNVSSNQEPGVCDRNPKVKLTSEQEFYAGCYARATLRAFAYDYKGKKGVSFGLNNIQKLDDGESFSGRKSAANDFEAFESDENLPESYETEEKESDMFA